MIGITSQNSIVGSLIDVSTDYLIVHEEDGGFCSGIKYLASAPTYLLLSVAALVESTVYSIFYLVAKTAAALTPCSWGAHTLGRRLMSTTAFAGIAASRIVTNFRGVDSVEKIDAKIWKKTRNFFDSALGGIAKLGSDEVVIVGGGPVGLYTACQLKIRKPETEITIVDKHGTYQRKHLLHLSHASLAGAPKDDRIQEVLQRFKGHRPSGIFSKSSTIPVNTIEKELAELASGLGIRVLKNTRIDEDSDLKAAFPQARIIIGADGAHSTVRKIIGADNMKSAHQLNHIIQFKYLVEGETRKLDSFKESYPASKTVGHLIEEHVGKPNDEGQTPVTLRMFVSAEEYEKVQDASFRNPYKLNQLPRSLRQKCEEWRTLRYSRTQEQVVVGSENITATPLGTYASPLIVKRDGDLTYCLVGDAAFGVPFFRSLNNGFLSATKLAGRISYALENPDQQDRILHSYSRFVKNLAMKEIAVANAKNAGIKFAELIVGFNRLMPWQFVKFPKASQPELA